MRPTLRLLVAAPVLLGLIGFGGGDAPKKRRERKATERQVSEVIARTRPDVLEAIDRFDALVASVPLYCDLTCRLNVTTLATVAETMEIHVDAIDDRKPRNGLYFGTVPRPLRPLVRSTLRELRQTADVATEFVDCVENDPLQEGCALFDVRFAVTELQDELQAWDAYL